MNEMQMGPPAGGDVFGTIVVVIGILATVFAFIVAIRATASPGELDAAHPKNLILADDR